MNTSEPTPWDVNEVRRLTRRFAELLEFLNHHQLPLPVQLAPIWELWHETQSNAHQRKGRPNAEEEREQNVLARRFATSFKSWIDSEFTAEGIATESDNDGTLQ